MQYMHKCTNNILARVGVGGSWAVSGAFGVACDAALLGRGNWSRVRYLSRRLLSSSLHATKKET